MFQGLAHLTLDSKGRLSVPTRYRETLAAMCEGRITITRHLDPCLLIYPRPTWETKRSELAALPFEAREMVRLVVGSARDLDIDTAGRVLVPPELREAVGLERDVMLLGVGNYLELWDRKRRLAQEQAAFADGLPEPAQRFTF